MEQPKVPAVSTSEMEQFWVDGEDARQPAAGSDQQPETSTTTLIESQRPLPVDLLCFACGERGGEWQRGSLAGSECRNWFAKTIENNQRVALAADESGRYLYTHICRGSSVGIDLPGVGLTPPRPEISSACAGRGDVVGDGPLGDLAGGGVDIEITASGLAALEQLAQGCEEESPRERRDRLASQLLVFARDLALAQIDPALDPEPPFCTECIKEALTVDAIAHEEDCRTGRVLKVVAEMIATLEVPTKRKETVPGGELPDAGGDLGHSRPRGHRTNDEYEALRVTSSLLLSALYAMIAFYGMPTEPEAAAEVHSAIVHAELHKDLEVLP